MRGACATCSTAIRSRSASRRTARRCEQFLRYTHEQGIAHRHAKVEDIFPKGMMVEVHT